MDEGERLLDVTVARNQLRLVLRGAVAFGTSRAAVYEASSLALGKRGALAAVTDCTFSVCSILGFVKMPMFHCVRVSLVGQRQKSRTRACF